VIVDAGPRIELGAPSPSFARDHAAVLQAPAGKDCFDTTVDTASGSSRGLSRESALSRRLGGDWWALQGSNLRQTD
jgi:hypothetical protein